MDECGRVDHIGDELAQNGDELAQIGDELAQIGDEVAQTGDVVAQAKSMMIQTGRGYLNFNLFTITRATTRRSNNEELLRIFLLTHFKGTQD